MSKIRTFVAVEAAAGVCERAADVVKALAAARADVRWVEPETLHWTVKFLGDVDEREITQVCRTVAAAAARHAPFELVVRNVGAFPNLARPRTIWLGATEGSDALVALAKDLDDSLAKLGFPREIRRYEPHLTIGRVRSSENMAKLADFMARIDDAEGGGPIDEVVVYSSILRPSGPIHEALARAPLGV